ncbi:hypothetical protein Tco_0490067 [Tanacetum coccineum]
MKNIEHGRMILESVEHSLLIWPTIEENGVTRIKKYEELSATEKIQADYDLKATNIILQGLPSDVYSLINHHRVAKDLWERIQLLMQGTSLTKSFIFHMFCLINSNIISNKNIVVVMIVVEKSVVVYSLDSCNLGTRIVDFDDTPIVIDKHVRAVTFAFHKGETVATSLSVGNLGLLWLVQAVQDPQRVPAMSCKCSTTAPVQGLNKLLLLEFGAISSSKLLISSRLYGGLEITSPNEHDRLASIAVPASLDSLPFSLHELTFISSCISSNIDSNSLCVNTNSVSVLMEHPMSGLNKSSHAYVIQIQHISLGQRLISLVHSGNNAIICPKTQQVLAAARVGAFSYLHTQGPMRYLILPEVARVGGAYGLVGEEYYKGGGNGSDGTVAASLSSHRIV